MIRTIIFRSLCALVGGAGLVVVTATLLPVGSGAIVIADALIRMTLGG